MTRTQRRALWARTPKQYEISDLPSLGWITITEHGSENTYFTLPDGSIGFVKM